MDLRVSPLTQELIERIGWFIRLRWFASAAVIAAVLLAKFALGLNLPFEKLLLIGVAVSIYNSAFRWYLPRLERFKDDRREGACRRFVALQVGLDWLLLSLIAYYSGGIRSPVLLFFVFHVLLASILLPPRDCYALVTFAFSSVALLTMLEYFKLIPHVSIRGISDFRPFPINSTLILLAFFGAMLYITTFLATSIIQAVRARERRLMSLQAELQKAYGELEESVMMRSQFILTVTHELRAPLATIQSLLNVIMEGYAGSVSDKARELIERAERRVRFLIELVNDLLDVTIKQVERSRSRRVEIDIIEVAREVVDGFQAEAKAKGIAMKVHIPDHPIILESNERDLQKLFGNLLSNAVKYTPSGGEVSLIVREKEDKVEIEVADTGIGIPEEARPRLFKEFFRAENAKRMSEYGTGLGLTIVKNILDEHGGEISVKSELGKGTRFLISLPRHSLRNSKEA
ncbi:TPA: HAMP domain-containing histidine kinase [Candidatus Poribacteria bacterium]|nr:HAMP domain-containing histidine kinase [Candidatus Poribacteria bacterium]